jgi:hypothetical protein
MQALDVRLAGPKVQRGGNDRGGDQSEADGTGDCRQVEKTAAHQWNICALPAW